MRRVGSDITGFGPDLIIVDDPIQADDAGSEHVKARVRDWMSNSVSTRFNDQAKGALILVMHRLAPDELSATLEPNADFVLKLPMIAEKEEKFESHGKLTIHRRPGEVLNPARMTPEERPSSSRVFHVTSGMVSISSARRQVDRACFRSNDSSGSIYRSRRNSS